MIGICTSFMRPVLKGFYSQWGHHIVDLAGVYTRWSSGTTLLGYVSFQAQTWNLLLISQTCKPLRYKLHSLIGKIKTKPKTTNI